MRSRLDARDRSDEEEQPRQPPQGEAAVAQHVADEGTQRLEPAPPRRCFRWRYGVAANNSPRMAEPATVRMAAVAAPEAMSHHRSLAQHRLLDQIIRHR